MEPFEKLDPEGTWDASTQEKKLHEVSNWLLAAWTVALVL
jgi:hypothetical protein